jgi:hypothetical protein
MHTRQRNMTTNFPLNFSLSKPSSNRFECSTATLISSGTQRGQFDTSRRAGARLWTTYPGSPSTASTQSSMTTPSPGIFTKGLHGDLKDELAVWEWKTLKELQVLAGRLDARVRQRRQEKDWEEKASKPKSNPWANTPPRRDNGTFLPAKPPFPSSPASTANPFARSTPPAMGSLAPAADGSTPMELDALKLTADEKARCRAENRCYGCKKLGHIASKCRSRREWKVATVEVQLSQPENDDAQE